MNDHYHAHYETLVNNGVPPELVAKASLITAGETVEQPRTPEQQQVVTEAWHHLTKHWEKKDAEPVHHT